MGSVVFELWLSSCCQIPALFSEFSPSVEKSQHQHSKYLPRGVQLPAHSSSGQKEKLGSYIPDVPIFGEHFSHLTNGNNFLKLDFFLSLFLSFYSPQFCLPSYQPWLMGLLFCLLLAALLIRVYHMGVIKSARAQIRKEKRGNLSKLLWFWDKVASKRGWTGLSREDTKNGNLLVFTQDLWWLH